MEVLRNASCTHDASAAYIQSCKEGDNNDSSRPETPYAKVRAWWILWRCVSLFALYTQLLFIVVLVLVSEATQKAVKPAKRVTNKPKGTPAATATVKKGASSAQVATVGEPTEKILIRRVNDAGTGVETLSLKTITCVE